MDNLEVLSGATFVFLASHDALSKATIMEWLEAHDVPFIDVGMGVEEIDGRLTGLLRVSTSLPGRRGQARRRIPPPAPEHDDYGRNIQTSDLNALDALLAVGAEHDENPAEAALREVSEESGLTAVLEGPALALPTGFPHAAVAAPWWVVEMAAAPDNHTPVAHIHVDQVFVAWAAECAPTSEPAHQARWFTAIDLVQARDVAEDSRLLAVDLMQRVIAGQVALPA
ncbi:NUDIX domain-containing protein [Sphaerisporangium fuscum]|uniref:NUDIX domain-containing protein n=1 Tax=Sphaerisporangium fuscum TaxID=2835868 RepID=UPI001BDC3622|nr:NUDIX domain-containing protein [Sphaerisporangium fuscum]